MKTGAASVALAAAALFTPAALADAYQIKSAAPTSAAATTNQFNWSSNHQPSDRDRRYSGYGDRRGDHDRDDYRYGRDDDEHRYGDRDSRGYGSHGWHRYSYGHHDRDHDRHHVDWRERWSAQRTCEAALDARTDQFFPGPFGDADFAGTPSFRKTGMFGKAIEVTGPVRVTNRFGSRIVPASCTIRHDHVVGLNFNPAPFEQSFGHAPGRYGSKFGH